MPQKLYWVPFQVLKHTHLYLPALGHHPMVVLIRNAGVEGENDTFMLGKIIVVWVRHSNSSILAFWLGARHGLALKSVT